MSSNNCEYKIVFVTAPDTESEAIGKNIVNEKLAACVNIVDPIKSIYWWDNKVNISKESLLIFKTTTGKVDNLIAKIKEIHSYDVPEVIVLDIKDGNNDYLKWISNSVIE